MLSQFPSSTSLLFHPTLPPSLNPVPPVPSVLLWLPSFLSNFYRKKEKKKKKKTPLKPATTSPGRLKPTCT